MSDSDNQNNELSVVNLVYDALAAQANTPTILCAGELSHPMGSGIISKIANRGKYLLLHLWRELLNFALCSRQVLDCVNH